MPCSQLGRTTAGACVGCSVLTFDESGSCFTLEDAEGNCGFVLSGSGFMFACGFSADVLGTSFDVLRASLDVLGTSFDVLGTSLDVSFACGSILIFFG